MVKAYSSTGDIGHRMGRCLAFFPLNPNRAIASLVPIPGLVFLGHILALAVTPGIPPVRKSTLPICSANTAKPRP